MRQPGASTGASQPAAQTRGCLAGGSHDVAEQRRRPAASQPLWARAHAAEADLGLHGSTRLHNGLRTHNNREAWPVHRPSLYTQQNPRSCPCL
jgi:hypothetical protein